MFNVVLQDGRRVRADERRKLRNADSFTCMPTLNLGGTGSDISACLCVCCRVMFAFGFLFLLRTYFRQPLDLFVSFRRVARSVL